MPAYAPQVLTISLAGSTTPLIWTHWHGNPLDIDISLTGSADFTSCTLLRAELHTRQDSATDGDDPSLLEYVEEANPSTEPTRLTFTAAQLNNLISDGETSRRLWVCIIGIIDGSKYTLGAAWLTVLRDNYSGDTDTAHTPIDNNFLTETVFAASAVRYDQAQSLTAGQTLQARDNIDAAGSGAVTASGLTMATARLLGRSIASTGAIEEISIGSGLSLSAGTLSSTASSAWGSITGDINDQTDLGDGSLDLLAASTSIIVGTGDDAAEMTPTAMVVSNGNTGAGSIFYAGYGSLTTASITGSASTSFLSIDGTWNTTGAPTAFKVNVTDAASNAASLLADFQLGGSPKVSLGKDSSITLGGDAILARTAAATIRQGGDASATPVSQYFSVQNASGTDIAGANRYIDGSQSTGSGAGGSIIFRTSPAGGAGTGTNALATAFTAFSNGDCGFAGDTVYFGTSTPSAPKARIDFPAVHTIDLYNGYGTTGTRLLRASQDLFSVRTSLAIGVDAESPLVFLYGQNAAELQLGKDHATVATAQTLKAHDVTTGTGASLIIAGGRGSVAGGDVILATSATNGPPVKRSIVHEGAIGTGNATPVTIATATVNNGKSVGGELLVTVEAEESGHVTTITEHSTFSAVANGGTVTAVIQAAPSTSTVASTNAGTLTLLHGVIPGSNTVAVQVTPTSSYAGPTITIRFQIRFNTSDPGMQVTIP